MAWFVEPLQRKNADGLPTGLWHLCAKSDEGGGFYNGCDHDHASVEEAQNCEEAKLFLGGITGFPAREVNAVDDPYDRGRRDMLNALLALNPEVARKLHDIRNESGEFANAAGKLPFDVVLWVTAVAEQLGIEPRETT